MFREPGPEWERCERHLAEAGMPLPATQKKAWVQGTGEVRWLLAALDTSDTCRGALGLQVRPSRAMPGHKSLRADKVGLVGDTDVVAFLIDQLHQLSLDERGLFRLDVALSCADAERRAVLRSLLQAAELEPSPTPEAYRHTSLVDLGPDEDELMANLHKTARRHIRATSRGPVVLRSLDDLKWAPAMAALLEETYLRTGTPAPNRRLEQLLALAHEDPRAVHIVGLFDEQDDSMLSFACGHREGPRVRYAEAASTRRDDVKLPLGYGPMWELFLWAKREGAEHFDLGGITSGSHEDDDPLGGISDFKRYFRGTITEVGEEWCLELLPARARWVRFAHRVATWARESVRDPLRQLDSIGTVRDAVVHALDTP